jgi:TatD DNase family protein
MAIAYVDMHCHLDLYDDPVARIAKVAETQAYVLSVTTTPTAWAHTAYLASNVKRIRTALGLHPQLASERRSELSLFDRLLSQVRYVGEVGLDGSAECRPFWKDQLHVFNHVLDSCSQERGRILTIHSRGAAEEVLAALKHYPDHGKAVLHWFSGTVGQLEEAIDMGCWFSVGVAMLKTKKGRSLASRMPKDKVLTETDGPFGSKNGRALEPADCKDAITTLAEIWGVDDPSAKSMVFESFRRLTASN